MKVFRMVAAENHEFLKSNAESIKQFKTLSGKTVDQWSAPEVELISEENGKKLLHSDLFSQGALPLIIRDSSIGVIDDILVKNGNLVEVNELGGSKMWAFNSQEVDALDSEQSILETFSGTQKIMAIVKHAFKINKLKNVDIFHIPNRPFDPFCTERFVDRVTSAGLKGINFQVC